MRKKIVSTSIGLMSMCMISVPAITTHATEMPARQPQNVRTETFLSMSDNISEGKPVLYFGKLY